METFDQSLPTIEIPTIDYTKSTLRYKLSYHGLTYGVTAYEEESLDMMIEYLYIYMKSVLREMAQYKRTYKFVCPPFNEEDDNDEDSDESKKKLKPWETPYDYRKVTPEFKKRIEENDKREAKEIALMKRQLLHKVKDMKSKPSLMKYTDIDYAASLNTDRSKDLKKNNKNIKESIDDSSVKVIEILKNLHDKPQKKGVYARGKEETYVSQEGYFLQHHKQNSSKESNKQDESMDIVDVSEDEQSVSEDDDIVKHKIKRFKSSHLKHLSMRSEKYVGSKMHEEVKECINCGELFGAKFCDQCAESAETTKIQSKKRCDLKAERQKLKDCLQIQIKYDPVSRDRYPCKVFDVKDMFQLFKENPLIVPLRSIYQITMMRISNSQPSESSYYGFPCKFEIVK